MEGGVAAMATASGQAAITLALLNICQAGQHIVTSSTLYGGTYNLFAATFPKLGIEVTFVHPDASEDEIMAAFRPTTRALYAETIGNPGLNVLDFEKFSRKRRRSAVACRCHTELVRFFFHAADKVFDILDLQRWIDNHQSR